MVTQAGDARQWESDSLELEDLSDWTWSDGLLRVFPADTRSSTRELATNYLDLVSFVDSELIPLGWDTLEVRPHFLMPGALFIDVPR